MSSAYSVTKLGIVSGTREGILYLISYVQDYKNINTYLTIKVVVSVTSLAQRAIVAFLSEFETRAAKW